MISVMNETNGSSRSCSAPPAISSAIAHDLAAAGHRVDAAHHVLGRVVEGVEEAVDVDVVLVLDLVGEDVDREDVDVLERVDHARVEDDVGDGRGAPLARVRVEHVDGGAAGAVVDAVLLQHGVVTAVPRVRA